jgi:hypothetical protein
MKFVLSLFLAAAAVLVAGCGQGSSSPTQATNAPANAANNNNPADYLGALVQAKKTADKTIDVSYLNEALNQFNVQEGHYPKTLQELTPNYVAKIPDLPAGYKLDYNPVKGEVKAVKQ